MNQLITGLLDLLHELHGRDIPITVGGGFGLYLKRRHLEATGQRMLLDRLPEPRSTNDLDLFLRTEILVDLERTRQVANAIDRLEYKVVDEAKYLQWERPIVVAGVTQTVKIDILVGPLGDERKNLHVSMPRVRPKGDIKFHAHAVEEAVQIEDAAWEIPVTGNRSTGESCTENVFVPQAFPYLMMKLHAFRDREARKEPIKAQQHALDLYAIVGMMTEEEYNQAKHWGASLAENEHVREARKIVHDHFASPTAVGILRLREHPLFRNDFQLDGFISVHKEIFPDG